MILLDTHVWFWMVDQPEALSADAAHLIRTTDQLALSAISLWEYATLLRKGRIQLNMPSDQWIAMATTLPGLDIIPVDQEAALLAGSDALSMHGTRPTASSHPPPSRTMPP